MCIRDRDLLELDDWWWLITPYASNAYYARYVSTDGSLNSNYAYIGYYGVRPVSYTHLDVYKRQE